MSDPTRDARWIRGGVAVIATRIVVAAGLPTAPATIRLKVRSPVGIVYTYNVGAGAIIRDGIGAYHVDLELTMPGIWAWRWEADAPNAGAAEGVMSVQRSRF